MKSGPFIAFCAAVLFWIQPLYAADYDEGVAAFENGDYAIAQAALMPLAKLGDGDAQYYIGVMYMDGLGIEANPKEAFKWLSFAAVYGVLDARFRMAQFYLDDKLGVEEDLQMAADWYEKAAKEGHAKSRHRLGLMYRDGQGRAQSYGHAIELFRAAAEQGLADAQYELGNLYYRGLGVPQDFTRALKWNTRSAEQGVAKAQVNVGFLYARGHGVEKNLVEAHKWFNLAAAMGDEEGIAGRATVALQMNGPQIAEAQRIAGDWRPKAEPLKIPKKSAPPADE